MHAGCARTRVAAFPAASAAPHVHTPPAFLPGSKTSANVSAVFLLVCDWLGDRFGKGEMFVMVVTDNGTEFTNPTEIEFDCDGNHIPNLFHCAPGSFHRKPYVEWAFGSSCPRGTPTYRRFRSTASRKPASTRQCRTRTATCDPRPATGSRTASSQTSPERVSRTSSASGGLPRKSDNRR